MNNRPIINPVIFHQPTKLPNPHQWCTIIEITNFGDIDRRFLDHRCDECRATDEAVER